MEDKIKFYKFNHELITHQEYAKKVSLDENINAHVPSMARSLSGNYRLKDHYFRPYLLALGDKIIGSSFVNERIDDFVFLEYAILTEYAKNGYGVILLNETSERIFSRDKDLEKVKLVIINNAYSLSAALKAGFVIEREASDHAFLERGRKR